MLKEALEELIDLNELSDEKFSIETSVNRAKEILELIRQEDTSFKAEFEDNSWTFEKHLIKGTFVTIDFSKLEGANRFRKWDLFSVDLVKCWVAGLLGQFYPAGVSRSYSYLLSIIEISDFFNPNKVNETSEYLRNYSPSVIKCVEEQNILTVEEIRGKLKEDRAGVSVVINMTTAALNFLTYSELESFHFYNKALMEIKKALPKTTYARQLPSGKDVIKLDISINRYFEYGINSPSKLFFAPILLWWKLTNIIPMRIIEFCMIRRPGVSETNERYYIKLPREKKRASKRRVQVIDTLEISKDIYDLFDEYNHLTNQYGESKTVVSFRATTALERKSTNRHKKNNPDYMAPGSFRNLLKKFYSEVVIGEFHYEVEQEVRPNDTRHFAFCSLLMQGVSPIEIARLGGHSTIEAQYHYSNHTEYFIDIEVKKLIDGFIRKDGELRGNFEGHEITYEEIEQKSFQFPSNDTRLEVEVGYCTDELQRCESKECMLCKKWWIHPKDLLEIKPLIEEKIRERKEKIIEMGRFLKNINESITETMVSDVDPTIFNAMETKGASIQDHLVEIARLEILKGVDVDE